MHHGFLALHGLLCPAGDLSAQMEAVSIKQEGDMRNLDHLQRISLAVVLDHNDLWKQLGKLMNLAQYEAGFATCSSPTRELLSMFEVRVRSSWPCLDSFCTLVQVHVQCMY